MNRALETPASEPEQSQGDTHVVCRATEIQAVLRDGDLARILGLKHSRFYLRKKRGEFRVFELEQLTASTNTRYSGVLVAEWLRTGDLPRRFFQRAPRVTRRGRKAGTAPGVSQRRLTIAQSSR